MSDRAWRRVFAAATAIVVAVVLGPPVLIVVIGFALAAASVAERIFT